MKTAAYVAFSVLCSMLLAGSPFSLLLFPLNYISEAVNPLSQEEIGELSFLACLEDSASGIPDRETIRVIVSENDFDEGTVAYLTQRLDELLYPRLRIVDTESRYDITVLSYEKALVDGSLLGKPESINSCGAVGIMVERVMKGD